jgi:hypothetical protein
MQPSATMEGDVGKQAASVALEVVKIVQQHI